MSLGFGEFASAIHFISHKFLAIPKPHWGFLKSLTQSAKELSFQSIQNSHLNLSNHALFFPCNLIPTKYGLLMFNLWILLTFGICEVKKHSCLLMTFLMTKSADMAEFLHFSDSLLFHLWKGGWLVTQCYKAQRYVVTQIFTSFWDNPKKDTLMSPANS